MRICKIMTAAAVALALTLGAGLARAADTIRVGVLKYGTVNWELTSLASHGFDTQSGIKVEMIPFASNQATLVALQAGEVNVIVSDWLWVSRQRAAGRDFTFVPFSSSVGALMVPANSDIRELADLKGRKVGVAGGPLDKGWLTLRGLAERDAGFDPANENEIIYGAPPLLAKKLEQGELDAVLNYWHYAARLEAKGFRRVLDANDAAIQLGAEGAISAIGYVFDERWANEHRKAMLGFVHASQETKELLKTSDAAWEELRPAMGAEDDATFTALRDRFRAGIPERPLKAEIQDTAHIYRLLAKLGGEKLVGPATEMAPGTFWHALVDGS
ncbi:NitT/TauT family transport system substrate-binding protein [Breoghania corrubedonensis]|uniref:NitT/TauT family transport system substrate-binding protein n=1 Tax=Breoghania corrubedonensis TaxID=665038 RepID=A0A2T5VE17_9HYPH|nr:ABC transporter substrate-binding protein [Breoghania corrubedonensis]PTW61983.1 NitT/TauT family transport system substrate-binding protein [Breoghania corrubedonensis]